MNRRQYVTHAAWFLILLAGVFAALWFTAAPPAGAEPPPPAPACFEADCPVWACARDGNQRCGPVPAPPDAGGLGSGYARCGDRLVPADVRVDISNPLGGWLYRRALEAMCPAPGGGAQ
ncbi:hypothetical protein [Mycolicibacter algericus]|uniref:Lipoprotein n=2 Tax=Mycolicibacter algericus TaxID=1288388 RepID=A0A7I9Y7K6_MYCAL|nr:hypothetical protein [Mycolicibacter algericus]OQZ99073.1 hypothetical protein BST10_02465 [Mycolicibacter algericus DSM 45454]GFG84567.1 hypothetical protein MALGJ_12430 [Mycolicibacter algericus]